MTEMRRNADCVVAVGVQIGDLQSSYTAAQQSEDAFPEHVDTQQLLKQLRQHFAELWACCGQRVQVLWHQQIHQVKHTVSQYDASFYL